MAYNKKKNFLYSLLVVSAFLTTPGEQVFAISKKDVTQEVVDTKRLFVTFQDAKIEKNTHSKRYIDQYKVTLNGVSDIQDVSSMEAIAPYKPQQFLDLWKSQPGGNAIKGANVVFSSGGCVMTLSNPVVLSNTSIQFDGKFVEDEKTKLPVIPQPLQLSNVMDIKGPDSAVVVQLLDIHLP